jgi:hypothetical protein
VLSVLQHILSFLLSGENIAEHPQSMFSDTSSNESSIWLCFASTLRDCGNAKQIPFKGPFSRRASAEIQMLVIASEIAMKTF